MTSFIRRIEAKLTSFYWTVSKIKTGYRITVSVGTKDEIGYIHVVPETSLPSGWYSVLNVEIAPEFQNQGLGKNLYRRALKEIKRSGGKGIISLATERTPEATRLWKSLKEAKYQKGTWVLW